MTYRKNISRMSIGTVLCAAMALSVGAVAQERGEYPYHDPQSRYYNPGWFGGNPGYYTGPKVGQTYQRAENYGEPRWFEDDRYVTDRAQRQTTPMEAYDTNRDGMLDNAEAASFAELQFRILDVNNDGAINWEEFRSADRALSDTFYYGDQVLYENARRDVEARFSNYDGPDNDGIITRREFMQEARTQFDDLDRDRDGQVSLWDYRARQGYDQG